MSSSSIETGSAGARDRADEIERVDRVAVAVFVVFILFTVVRGLVPALLAGQQVALALGTLAVLAGSLGLVLRPAWRRRAVDPRPRPPA